MAQTQMNACILNFPSSLAQPIGHQHRGPGRLPQGVFSIKGKLVARLVKLRRELADKESELQAEIQRVDQLTRCMDSSYDAFHSFTVEKVKANGRIEQLRAEIDQARSAARQRVVTRHAVVPNASPLVEALTRCRALGNQVEG